jgi:hypothetical protein
MTTTSSVYWLHQPEHTDMFSQGYIGVSKNFKKRLNQHYKLNENPHLRNAIDKYGWDNLIKQQILIGDEQYCFDIEKKLRPTSHIGWNIMMGGIVYGKKPIGFGHKNIGRKVSTETRKKISDAIKEVMKDPIRLQMNRIARLGKTSPRKGVVLSEETKLKLSLSKIGKPSKIKGTKKLPEMIEKYKKAVRNVSWVCIHCNKAGFGKGAMNRWHFDNCKQKEII